MRCNENLPRSLGVPCNIRRAFPTVGTRQAALSGERGLCRQVSGFPQAPEPWTTAQRAAGEKSAASRHQSSRSEIRRYTEFHWFCRIPRADYGTNVARFKWCKDHKFVTSKSCVFDQHSLFLQLIGDVVDQSGGPEMFNPRNCHVLSLRIEFAAAGACLRSMRTAAGTAPSRFGMALSGVATPIHDPGGGPGG
jgi:hypothetical protein